MKCSSATQENLQLLLSYSANTEPVNDLGAYQRSARARTGGKRPMTEISPFIIFLDNDNGQESGALTIVDLFMPIYISGNSFFAV
jgi:hypothetical protein